MDLNEKLAARVVTRLDELAAITDEPGHICRTFLSPGMARTNELVGKWLREVGCEVTVDGWGNVIGRLEARRGSPLATKTLVLGSHLDTVRNAGKFDGPMGVVVSIAALASLKERGIVLPFAVEVIGFSDEEGVRFQTAYLGSKAVAGSLKSDDLKVKDKDGVTLAEAVAKFQELWTAAVPSARYRPSEMLGYVEVHLEQGPVLEDQNRALGVVGQIAAQTRALFHVVGCAGHAGTTPMTLRRDALAGAAEVMMEIERLAKTETSLVATVGQLHLKPGASNVIPGEVEFTLDLRHPDASMVDRTYNEIVRKAGEICAARRLTVEAKVVQKSGGVACDLELTERLASVVKSVQGEAPRLVSGAGHDGVVMSRLGPIGMIFVRCKAGLSHHPDEFVSEADIAASLTALTAFLEGWS